MAIDPPESDREADWDLVRRHVAGQRDAFRRLYERYQEKVYASCFRILGEAAAAEDLAQEIFVKIHDELRHFKFQSKFSTWLYRIAVNHAINKANEIARHGRIHERIAKETRPETAPPPAFADRFMDDRVQAALLQLSDKLRVIVALRYLEGLSYDEIAEVLEISIGTVKSRLFLAHETLRPLLKDALE
jgi:RNA polymerase sigma-70 factor (ECF subfamily)